jgi:hypothetical protein
MPFSEQGWRPDLIMNPHGFPSRMTVGKMLECISSKAAVLEGMFSNGSAFDGTPAQEIYRTRLRRPGRGREARGPSPSRGRSLRDRVRRQGGAPSRGARPGKGGAGVPSRHRCRRSRSYRLLDLAASRGAGFPNPEDADPARLRADGEGVPDERHHGGAHPVLHLLRARPLSTQPWRADVGRRVWHMRWA